MLVSLKLLIIILIATAFTACKSRDNSESKSSILLFKGTGVSPNDVAAIQTILEDNHLSYTTINSATLNGMRQADMQRYRLLIMPGGNFVEMGKSLTVGTAANIRYAVQHGMNYLGICAGGFLAGSSAYYNGFNLTSGVTFGFYSAENKGIHKAALAITSPGSATLEQYWEDGPQLSGWEQVVAKYPDGTPAVTEGNCGSGFVLLTGIHAEAPEYWRVGMVFNTPATTDNAYAAMLINAALNGKPLLHY